MARADIEAAAEEKYPDTEWSTPATLAAFRAAYIQGRLDQAEADEQIAESLDFGPDGPPLHQASRHRWGAKQAAAAIRKGVE